ncbi:MAG: S49 family peptidase [Candidatus Yonathbacteria bacterium]|nr:S49 family peptidase [Candidatus Yonathbacteria bacterium]NTW47528.1 S49 family peptidase [Candidatus Yonathbacteria bacterium]
MADWTDILREIQSTRGDFDGVRRKYLKQLSIYTGRNTIIYYSGWLQKPGPYPLGINDLDKNAFMATIRGLDRSKGLDLILHTPGGEVAATESIIDYLCQMFLDIRVIVPQLAMSGGTMIACSADSIVMGKQSSLGPIDPQVPTPFGQVPAHALIEEFEKAYKEIKRDQIAILVWQPILSKYIPTLHGECQKAMKWAEEIVTERLKQRMLRNLSTEEMKNVLENIMRELGNHSVSLSHSRHLSVQKCKDIGLNIYNLEEDQKLQDLVLSVHHATMHTLSSTLAFKITENQKKSAVIQAVPVRE